jgi:hypothetical protein
MNIAAMLRTSTITPSGKRKKAGGGKRRRVKRERNAAQELASDSTKKKKQKKENKRKLTFKVLELVLDTKEDDERVDGGDGDTDGKVEPKQQIKRDR